MAENGNSELSKVAEAFYIVDVYIMGAICIVISIILLTSYTSILHELKDEENRNKYKFYRQALKAARMSALLTMIASILKMLFGNDLLIPWKAFDFASITDSLVNSILVIAKILFYFGFTFILLSILKKDKIDSCLKIWMILVAIAMMVFGTSYIMADSSQHSPQETGIASVHNFRISMYLGHDGADMIQYILMPLVLIDFTYVGVLLYLYINWLKKVKLSP